MSEILKPCPFCGQRKLKITNFFGVGSYEVRCVNENCEVNVYTFPKKKKAEAIKIWNTRAEDSKERRQGD